MRLADPQPAYCAACYQAPQGKRCVDFEAAYDGPVVPGTPEPVPVDDLVLCEDCLGAAFGFLDPQGQNEEIARLKQLLEDVTADNTAKDHIIHGLRNSTNELIDHPVGKRPPGKPRFEGVTPEARIEMVRRQRGTKRKAAA